MLYNQGLFIRNMAIMESNFKKNSESEVKFEFFAGSVSESEALMPKIVGICKIGTSVSPYKEVSENCLAMKMRFNDRMIETKSYITMGT